jgi:hypothetical protein
MKLLSQWLQGFHWVSKIPNERKLKRKCATSSALHSLFYLGNTCNEIPKLWSLSILIYPTWMDSHSRCCYFQSLPCVVCSRSGLSYFALFPIQQDPGLQFRSVPCRPGFSKPVSSSHSKTRCFFGIVWSPAPPTSSEVLRPVPPSFSLLLPPLSSAGSALRSQETWLLRCGFRLGHTFQPHPSNVSIPTPYNHVHSCGQGERLTGWR